jgi:predicted enzyme related to lactoylglutathione lyase
MAAGKAFPWHELYSPNVDASVDFYTNAIGMGTESAEMGGYGKYTMLTHNGQAVCGVVNVGMAAPGTPPHWATYLSVDDVDARLLKVLQHGGKVVVEAMDVPTVGRMALIADPQGAMIWLFKSAEV